MVSKCFVSRWLLCAFLAVFNCVAIADTKFPQHISTAQRIQSHGYPAETHYVDTPDGYVLQLFRIPYSHRVPQRTQLPVVLLFHGLFSCSDAYILTGPDSALAYNLADAGYDVWLGNARGNYYSRRSKRYSVAHPYFWRFSWHEIGQFDVTSMIDYVLEVSDASALHYVGHSQGTTTLLVALSTRPEYNAKLKTTHLMAPVAYMANVRDPMLLALSTLLGHHGRYSAFFGTQEFLPQNSWFMALGYQMCGTQSPSFELCSSVAVILEGYAPNANTSIYPLLAETHPAGASTDQILHYMQSMSAGHFRHFDYGARQNLRVYGQSEPPAYDISQVSAPMWLYYSDNDNLAVVDDVLRLAGELPHVQVLHHVADPSWAHADFTWATRAKDEINAPIIAAMNEFEQQQQHKQRK